MGTKADLQEHFGVAAGTLNEALRILQMRDLIGVRPGPGGGVFVAGSAPSLKLRHGRLRLRRGSRIVEECLAVRTTPDELVAVEAARFHSAQDIAELRRLLERMSAAKGNVPESLAVNWALHRRLAEAGSNQVLTSIYCALMDLVREALASRAGGASPPTQDRDRVERDGARPFLITMTGSGPKGRARSRVAAHRR